MTLRTTTKNWTNRTAAFGLGLALLGGMTLVASPAHAEEAPISTASPAATEAPAPTETTAPAETGVPTEEPTDPEVTPTPAPSEEPTAVPTPIEGTPYPAPTPAAPELPALAAGTVTITGEPVVGNTLKGATTGWPEGTTLTYEWGAGYGYRGGSIEGATSLDFTVTAAEMHGTLVLLVTGSLEGFASTTVSEFMTSAVTQPLKPAAAAQDSAALSQHLAAANVTVGPQTAVGLPAGALNPATAHTAQFTWTDQSDSYVDAYVYSQPTLVGSFAVVEGVVQIPLSAALLGALPGGAHTLVVTGQTSGVTQAVTLNIAASEVAAVRTGNTLAETGASATLPLTAAAVLLLLGGVLVMRNRRVTA